MEVPLGNSFSAAMMKFSSISTLMSVLTTDDRYHTKMCIFYGLHGEDSELHKRKMLNEPPSFTVWQIQIMI